MVNAVRPQLNQAPPSLWRDILHDLQDVFDLHSVCASFSLYVAKHLSCQALVALADSDEPSYSLWISNPDGSTNQERWLANEAGIDNLLASDHPAYLDKLDIPASEVMSSQLWLQARRRLIIAPIVQREQSRAPHPPVLLALVDPPENSDIDLELIGQISNLLRVFLGRAALREATDHRIAESAIVSEISQALGATVSIQEIYQLLAGPIRQTLNVETLSMGLVEVATGDILFPGELMRPASAHSPSVRLKRGQGIAGWVAEHKEPVIINNAYSDRRFFLDIDRSSGFRTQSMICIPLIVGGRTIGVLQAINRLSGEFTGHDLQLIQNLGGPVAAALENANLRAELVAESQRIEVLFEHISEGLVTINRGGIISKVNSAFSTLLGQDEANLIGSPIDEHLHTQRGELDSLVARVFDSEGEMLLAADLLRPDGRVMPVIVSGVAIENKAGNAEEAVLVFSDVTQVHEVERMRDDLFDTIAQELRTPLATILMYSRLLQEGKARQPDKAARFLGVIERESDRLQRMIRQVLDIAKMDAHEILRGPAAIELNPIIEDILPPFAERAVQKGLLFRQRIAPDLPPVIGNTEAIELILENLLDNAVKFTPSGNVQVNIRHEEGNVIIEISDEGIGIPPQSMRHLFKRFYRTQTAIERGVAGTGLGLYMVNEILKNYNGRISVQSTLGEGSVFTVQLPIAPL